MSSSGPNNKTDDEEFERFLIYLLSKVPNPQNYPKQVEYYTKVWKYSNK